MTVKDELHRLIDDLPEHDAHRLLQEARVLARMPRVLREASLDSEPLTDDDLAALAESKADLAAGRILSHEEARRRLLRP